MLFTDIQPKAYKRAILVAWLLLAVSLIIKLFGGGHFFEITATNETFIAVCNTIQNSPILTYFVSCGMLGLNLYFYWLAIIQQWKFTRKQFIVYLIIVFGVSLLKAIMSHDTWLFIDMIHMLILPIILLRSNGANFKHAVIAPLIGIGLTLCFQFISISIKDLALHEFITTDVLNTIIFSIDFYIMLLLYYLYSNALRQELTNKNKEI